MNKSGKTASRKNTGTFWNTLRRRNKDSKSGIELFENTGDETEEEFVIEAPWKQHTHVANENVRFTHNIYMQSNTGIDKDEFVPRFNETGFPLATVKLFKKPICTTKLGIAVAGGYPVAFRGKLMVKIGGFYPVGSIRNSLPIKTTLRRLNFKKRIVVLQSGNLFIGSSPAAHITPGEDSSQEEVVDDLNVEIKVPLANIRSININKHGAKVFSLLYLTVEIDNENMLLEHEIEFKSSDSKEIEKWVVYLLTELQNQALMYDASANVLKDEEVHKESKAVLLRMSVDLWTLARGISYAKTKEAQLRLANWLIEQGNFEEGKFWESYAKQNIVSTGRSVLEELQQKVKDST